jgi:hypothetical protein
MSTSFAFARIVFLTITFDRALRSSASYNLFIGKTLRRL